MKNKKHLAVVVACQTAFGREVVSGVIEYCKQHPQWRPFVAWEHSAESMKAVISERHADGVIAEVWRPEQMRVLQKSKAPIVEVSGAWSTTKLARVQSDNEAVGRLVATHLMERGFRHFGHFSVHTSRSQILYAGRRAGFVRELQKAGFQCNTEVYELNSMTRLCNVGEAVSQEVALDKWLAGLPKPAGVMCDNDHRAGELVLACQQAGIRVPDEIAVVGVGNDELACHVCSTHLSSVDIVPLRIGYAAASVIDRMSRTGTAPKAPVLLEPAGVVVRESSDIFTSENMAFVAAMRFIQEHAHQAIQVKDILKEVPVCRRTLEEDFLALLGRTPGRQIRHVRIQRAKNLLVESELPVGSIATQVGFASAMVFSEAFRKEAGMRPGEYRTKNRFDPSAMI